MNQKYVQLVLVLFVVFISSGFETSNKMVKNKEKSSFTIDGISLTFEEYTEDQFDVITDEFTAYGSTITPDINGLTLIYSQSDGKYLISGDVSIEFDNTTADATLSLELTSAGLNYLDFTITSSFVLSELTIDPSSGNFVLDYNLAEDQYEAYGTANAVFGGEEIEVMFGDTNTPGFVVKNGVISDINMTLSSGFDIDGITFSPDNLSYEYDETNGYYEMYGSTSVTIDDNSVDLDFGDADSPGLIIDNGTLVSLQATITADFTLKDITFSPNGLTFVYNDTDDQYEIYGNVSVTIDGNTIAASLGNPTTPGIEYKDSAITLIDIGLTTEFGLNGLTIKPNGLTFQYDTTEDQFEMYGDITAGFDDDEIDATLGDATTPGLIVNSGVLSSVNITVSADFDINGITFTPNDLTFQYDSTNEYYEMYGDVSTTLDSNTISLSFGDEDSPGLIIQNESLSQLSASITADFTMKDVTFSPSDLTFSYSSDDDQYEIYGDFTLTADNEEIDANLGDSDTPGFVYKNNSVTAINIGITTDFTINDLTIAPTDLTFLYNTTDDQFEMYGGITVKFDSEEIDAILGDSDSPGLIINNNVITQINMSVTADFEIDDVTFSPNGLTFVYDGTNEYYEMYGSLSGTLDDNSVAISLGDSDSPGLIINNGSLTNLTAGVTADFTMKGITFSPNGLTFSYATDDDQYEIYGGVFLSFDGETLDVTLGDSDSPGFEYKDGAVTSINIGVTADFTLYDLSISPESLDFIYDATDDQYEMYGRVDISFDDEEIEVRLGNGASPGLIISEGTVTNLTMTISADFELNDVTFSPEDLTFEYDADNQYYEMYGSMETTIDDTFIQISLGDSDAPGLIVENGSLTNLVASVSANIEISGITLEPDDLTFVYSDDDDQYEIYGALSFTIDNETFTGNLGDADTPGLEIKDNEIQSINIGITADVTVKDITLSSDDLTFVYSRDDDQYEMYGDVTVSFDSEEFEAILGDADDPGFIYKDSEITHISIGVTADFSIKSIEIIPDDLTFEYDTDNNYYEIYGSITVKVENEEIGASLGDSDNPGLLIENGTITEINLGITEDFTFEALEIKADDLGILWDSGAIFNIYGDASITVGSDDIDLDFGTSDNPGLVIENGAFTSFDVDINSDITLGNLEVVTKDLELKYANDVFTVTGEVEITEVFSVAVTFGGDEADGLEIDVSGSTPSFKIDGIKIEIDSADLGAIDIKSIILEFDDAGIEEASASVAFPEGWEVDATMKFTGNPATLNSIDIAYEATNIDDAIEIFEGLQLTYLEGFVDNLNDTSNLKVGGTLTTIYGGGVTIGSDSVTWLETSESVTISSTEFDMSADVNVGAYMTAGTNNWDSVLGDGTIDLDIVYGDYVKATIDVNIPSDPFIKADASAYFNTNGDFDALVDVTFYVPSSVPFIGGDELGSVDGAIRYLSDDIGSSYAAAWKSGKVVFVSYHVGAKYKFGSGDVSVFTSSSTINSIKDDISDDENNSRNAAINSNLYTFEISEEEAPRYMFVNIDWSEAVENAMVTVIGPEGIHELTKVDVEEQTDPTVAPEITHSENLIDASGELSTNFIFNSPSSMTDENVVHSKLVPGRYQLLITYPDTQTEIDTVQFLPYYQNPQLTVSAVKNENNRFDVSSEYWSSFPDSTYVSFYVNNANSTENSRLISHVKASNFNIDGYGSETLSYSPHFFTSNTEDLYFYAVVDDGANPPVTSSITQGFTHNPDLYGVISLSGTTTGLNTAGLRVFIDADHDGSFDTLSTGGLEAFDISNANGDYSFKDLEIGTYRLMIVLPRGYRLAGGEDRYSFVEFTFDGSPVELNLEIETY